MNITTETRENRTVIKLGEERLDAHNSGELRNRLLGLLEAGGQHLIVDLSGVSFIDSSGLSALVGQEAVERASEAIALLAQARRAICETHKELDVAKTQIGLGAVMYGGAEKPPQAALVGRSLRAIAS